MISLTKLLGVFILLSLLSFGGGNGLLPTLQHVVVEQQHWLTPIQFREIFSIGQMAPGPNLQSVILIGYYLHGITGATIVAFAFFIPASLLTFIVHRLWQNFSSSPWGAAIQDGLAPIVIGLMFSGAYMLGKIAIFNIPTALMAIASIVILARRRINPALIILSSGVIYLFYFLLFF